MKKNIKKILSVVLIIAMVGVIFMGCDTESVKSAAQKTSQDTKNAISAGANIGGASKNESKQNRFNI